VSAFGLALLALALALSAATLAAYAWTGVAPITAPRGARAAAVEMLRAAAGEGGLEGRTVYDLGCGTGALVLALARAFPGARVVGIELSPVPYAIARVRLALAGAGARNARVRLGDFFRAPLGDAAAVACYLMLRPMARLERKLAAELAPGTPVVAVAFLFRGRRPDDARRVGGALYPLDVALYRFGAAART